MSEIFDIGVANEELAAMQSRYDALIAATEHSVRHRDRRIAQLEAPLREADDYLKSNPLNSIGAGSKLHRDMRRALQGSEQETVPTLCAVCDQIKELHPNTHPWTARTATETPTTNSGSVGSTLETAVKP